MDSVAMMNKEQCQVNEKILTLTMEIIYLLTGEEYAVRKTPWDRVRNGSNNSPSEGSCRTQRPVTVHPPFTLGNKDQKILKLAKAIIRLLTGEVPVRCEDVTFYLSMDKWEFLAGQRDLFKDNLMEDHQPKDVMMEDNQLLGLLDMSSRTSSGGFYTPVSLSTLDTKMTSENADQEKNYEKRNKLRNKQGLIKGLYDSSPCGEVNLSNSTSRECMFPFVEDSNLQEEVDLMGTDHYTLTEYNRTDRPSTNNEVSASCNKGSDTDLIVSTKHRSPQSESNSCEAEVVLNTESGQHDASMSSEEENLGSLKNYMSSDHTLSLYRSTCPKDITSSSDEEHTRDGHISAAAEYEQTGHSGTSPYSHETNKVLETNTSATTEHDESDCKFLIVKEESVSGEEGDLTEHEESDANYLIIKEESISSDGGDLTDTDSYDPAEHTKIKYTSAFSSEESASCKETELADPNVYPRPSITGLRVLQCSECGKICANKSAFVSHQGKHTIDRMYDCPDCRKYFAVTSDLVHKGNHLTCGVCKTSSTCKANLLRHYKLHLGKELIPCAECRKKYTGKYNLITHRRMATPKDQLSCSECGKCFASNSLLMTHKTVHTGEKAFSCPTCRKRFNRKGNLLRHQIIHTGEKSFSCSECGARFRFQSSLLTHQMLHTGEKPFSCPECGKGFTTNSDLVKHRKIHTGEKPFACPTCGKRFNKKANFIRHQIVHTGDKKFPCPACGKCLADKSSLVAHQLTHTGEKPYSCSLCGKSFAGRKSLKYHERIHTGQKPFPCPECGKRFADKPSLAAHLRTHTGEKPYPCPVCGKCFAQKQTLKQLTRGRSHSRVPNVGKVFMADQGWLNTRRHIK